MFIEKRFFMWNDRYYVDPVRLGDSIKVHVQSGVITTIIEEIETKYFLTADKDISIGESKGLVEYIYHTKSKGDKIIGIDAFELPYPATEHVCKHLSKKFEPLTDIRSTVELKKNLSGDFLYVIFRDFIPMNLFIIRV